MPLTSCAGFAKTHIKYRFPFSYKKHQVKLKNRFAMLEKFEMPQGDRYLKSVIKKCKLRYNKDNTKMF
ncbi:hypothetical protein BBW65_07660 [Helicobacter enhydrae]|uniref:Uncharacterized protein n=1 Tax=Helicobacter enhydrae TaxID=222136 RepID=A0A1B1U3H8_9HELI|nr:hypothetical protein BBW65_00045 [Helicobacter enhydrae]ANV98679.1 hypothetical protein BBW65_07660 [Helicobacter enhydrae]